jgi:predicted DCC family thiol-disulfide oxidoreductase YuxK
VPEPIVLFDGVCQFCNRGVNFILKHDRAGRIRFAALQSEAGQRLLRRFGLRTDEFDTLVLVQGRRCYTRSGAALVRQARRLPPAHARGAGAVPRLTGPSLAHFEVARVRATRRVPAGFSAACGTPAGAPRAGIV